MTISQPANVAGNDDDDDEFNDDIVVRIVMPYKCSRFVQHGLGFTGTKSSTLLRCLYCNIAAQPMQSSSSVFYSLMLDWFTLKHTPTMICVLG